MQRKSEHYIPDTDPVSDYLKPGDFSVQCLWEPDKDLCLILKSSPLPAPQSQK